MTTRNELHRVIDTLSETAADELLDYASWLVSDGETLTAAELERARQGQSAIARGDYVTLEEARHQLGH